jgi:hypothetical protein
MLSSLILEFNRWTRGLIRKRAKRAINVSQRTRHFARLAQIAFDFAQARLSRRKERLFGMTIKR